MKSNKKTGKNRLDKYYHLAKEHGYRSRSAFKIIQLSKKFNIFQNCNVLVDLCAAPGGWLQVASKHLPVSSTIIGVDLVPIKPIKGVITFQSDIRTPKCRSLIVSQLKGGEVDVVLHDGSPNMGSNWNLDAFNQNVLVLSAAKLASTILKKGGIFVTKIFRSSDYNSLVWMLGNCFERIKVTKPQSSRNVSAEIFAICIGFKSLKGLDPRLFNIDYVFHTDRESKPTEATNKSLNQLFKEQKKRNREGYDESIYSEITVLEFLRSNTPANLLFSNNKITFAAPKHTDKPEDDQKLVNDIEHDPLTTEEVKLLCSDLKVAGKSDLKSLLKWRFKLLKSLPIVDKTKTEKSDVEPKNIAEDVELNIDEEDKKIKDKIKLDLRKAQRKERKLLKRTRKGTKEATSYLEPDPELFNLESLQGNELDDEYEYSSTDLESEVELEDYEPEDSLDPDTDRLMKMDVDLEVRHTIDKINETEKPKNAKMTKRQMANLEKSQEMKQFIDKLQYEAKLEAARNSESELGSESEAQSGTDSEVDSVADSDAYEESEVEQDSKAVREDEEMDNDLISSRWFDQEIFNQDQEKEKIKVEKKKKRDRRSGSNEEEQSFQVVPAISNSDVQALAKTDEFKDLSNDPDAIAQVQALGSLMINKKTRMELIDGAYNKKTFMDENLPTWFLDDENKHNKRQYPVTKELMKKYKAKLLEVKNRPIKKVLEAKQRKALRAQKRYKSILPKIEAISNDENSSGNAKKLLRGLKKIRSNKREKVYVVSRKTGSSKASKATGSGSRKMFKHVDRRMKQDNRRSKRKPRSKSRKARIH
ncbi:FtsJ cell division protein [Theileria orientalis]|uniref:Putative rRNA methyltransferase n=1 Tax=Theileria orientalis TaxID=68886 RepID=A0A976QR42_THEOR|nr:FtsJ cell division protein [Theileria orientalis]